MTEVTSPLEALRAQEIERQKQWATIPVQEILSAISQDLQGQAVKELIAQIRPLFLGLPDNEPLRAHVGSLLGMLNGVPQMIEQRIAHLNSVQ